MPPDDADTSDPCTCFCVLKHKAFVRGAEASEEVNYIDENLVYIYPADIARKDIEQFLGVIVSFYTFVNLSLGSSNLEFMAWRNSKISIFRSSHGPDGEVLLFILRVPSAFSDTYVLSSLSYLTSGLIFLTGRASVSNSELVKEYMRNNGERICKVVLPSRTDSPLECSFEHFNYTPFDSCYVSAVNAIELSLEKYDELRSVCFFFNDFFIASDAPVTFVRMFLLADPDEEFSDVYCDDHGTELTFCLMKIKSDAVTVFVLLESQPTQELADELKKLFMKPISFINGAFSEPADTSPSSNVILYHTYLHYLRYGRISPEFSQASITCHDLVHGAAELMEVVMCNAKELTICNNMPPIERYGFFNPSMSKSSFEELYTDLLKVMYSERANAIRDV